MATNALSGFPPALVRRLVIKIGSALLVDPAGEVRVDWLRTLVADVAARKAAGQQVIIVSSGAIALGARRLKLPTKPHPSNCPPGCGNRPGSTSSVPKTCRNWS